MAWLSDCVATDYNVLILSKVINYFFATQSQYHTTPIANRGEQRFEEDNMLRELIRPPYRIVYRVVNSERVDVLRVLRSSQNLLTDMFQ